MTWYCDFCKRELKGAFYKISDWKIDKDGYLVEYENGQFICKDCMNKGGW